MSDDSIGVDVGDVLEHVAQKIQARHEKAQAIVEANMPKKGEQPSPLAMAGLMEVAECSGAMKALKEVYDTGAAMANGTLNTEPGPTFKDEDIDEGIKAGVVSMLGRLTKGDGKLH